MSESTSYFSSHPSGVGLYISPPLGVYYRVIRTPGPEEVVFQEDEDGNAALDDAGQPILISRTPVPVLHGFTRKPCRYLDWDVPVETDVTYTIYTSDTENGTYAPYFRQVMHTSVDTSYSALEDSDMNDVVNIRDAMVVYLSTRLGQLARQGKVYTRQPGHRMKYNVTTEYEYADADLPIVSVGLGYGTGSSACLGWELTEEILTLKIVGAAMNKQERDTLTNALRGLIHEIDYFLQDLGCMESSYGHLVEGVQHSSPTVYLLEMDISTTTFAHIAVRETPWQLVPIGGWAGIDDGPPGMW